MAKTPLDNLFPRNGTLVDHLYYSQLESSVGGVLARSTMSKMSGVEWVKGHFREGKYVTGYKRDEGPPAKKKEFAPGLPSKKRMTPLPKIQEGSSRIWEFGVHDHHAVKAGKHFDLRLGDPRTGIAHSWALPKSRLPEPGDKVLAVMQPDHTIKYMDFMGMLQEGYGRGIVKLHKRGKTEVLFSSPDLIKFNVYEGREIHEYILRRTGGPTKWLLQNVAPTRETRPGLPSSKPKYKETAPEKVDLGREDEVVQAKVDGAHVLVDLQPGRQTRVFSWSPTVRKAGVIDHTFRIPGVAGHKADKQTGKTLLRGEVYAKDDKGRAIPAQDIGGMLNANVPKSRLLQQEKGLLTTAIFDVVKHKGKDVENVPYSEKLRILREIAAREPILHVPDTAESVGDKERLYNAIQKGEHPQTSEGVIVWKKDEPFPPTKAKHRPDFDVHVRKVFPAYGKDGKELDRAGGFSYSWTLDGPVVGRVGSGFDHELLRDMKASPDKYVGRVAKVRSQEKMPGKGALRSPSFSEWHIEKGKEAAAAWTPSKIHRIADKLGIAWDDDPKFKKFSEEVTGVSCIDKMSSSQRKDLATALLRRVVGGGGGLNKQAALDNPTARVISQLLQKSNAKERKARQLLADEKLKRVGTERTGTGTEEKPPITVDTTVQDKLSQAKMAGLKRNPFAPQIKRQLLERKGDIMKKIQRKLQSNQKVGRFSRMFNPRSIYGPDPKSGTIRV